MIKYYYTIYFIMAKAQQTTVRIKDLSTAIKALETLQAGKEKGQFQFATSVYDDFDNAIDNFKCAIAKTRGKKRNSIKMEIIKNEEESNFLARMAPKF